VTLGETLGHLGSSEFLLRKETGQDRLFFPSPHASSEVCGSRGMEVQAEKLRIVGKGGRTEMCGGVLCISLCDCQKLSARPGALEDSSDSEITEAQADKVEQS
jgi:hypothetical protein